MPWECRGWFRISDWETPLTQHWMNCQRVATSAALSWRMPVLVPPSPPNLLLLPQLASPPPERVAVGTTGQSLRPHGLLQVATQFEVTDQ